VVLRRGRLPIRRVRKCVCGDDQALLAASRHRASEIAHNVRSNGSLVFLGLEVDIGPANYVKDDEPLSLEFAIANHIFGHNGHLINIGMAVDIEASDVSMEDVLGGRESGRDSKRREQREAVLDAVTDEPQSARAIAVAAGVPRETTRRILIDLEVEGLVCEGVDGWVTQ
jgi:IclR helix-turn-helix domain